MNMNFYVIFLLSFWMLQKINLFINMNIKTKLYFFSHNKLKFNLEPRS